jgi:hypothetical protein
MVQPCLDNSRSQAANQSEQAPECEGVGPARPHVERKQRNSRVRDPIAERAAGSEGNDGTLDARFCECFGQPGKHQFRAPDVEVGDEVDDADRNPGVEMRTAQTASPARTVCGETRRTSAGSNHMGQKARSRSLKSVPKFVTT